MIDENNTNEAENVNENEINDVTEAKQENQETENTEVTQEIQDVEITEVKNEAEISEPVEEKIERVSEPVVFAQNITPEEFNWDIAGKKHDAYTHEERQKLEEIYDKTLSSIVEQEVVDGMVVAMNNREVVVNIGFKSDGVIALSEFRYNPELKIGDKVEVYVESQENNTGQLLLSHKKAKLLKAWDRVNNALEKDEIINGFVKCRTKGGLIVDVFGIEAFLPGSQIDVKPIRDYDIFVGKTMEFKVVKVNHEYKNVVVSHKALIEDELEHQKAEIIAKLEKGQVLEGTVKNITSYGVFIDLGGVDGLIHITDLSWGRINHPEEIVQLDQKINVVILDFDENKKRIALGLKQLTPHPWESLDANLKVGDKVHGKVVVIADYGAFVEINKGVEGLIHVSEMSWSQQIKHPAEFTKIGEQIEVVVLEVDAENRRLSLGHKQLEENPWDVFETIFTIDSIHKGTIVNLADKGAIVSLPYGVEGFAPTRHLVKEDNTTARAEETLDFKVIEFSKDNKKIIVSHTKIFQDKVVSEKVKETAEKKKTEKTTKKAVKKIKDNLEKTTLGDIQALADLKTEFDHVEKMPKKVKKEAVKAAEPEPEIKNEEPAKEDVNPQPEIPYEETPPAVDNE